MFDALVLLEPISFENELALSLGPGFRRDDRVLSGLTNRQALEAVVAAKLSAT